MTDINTLEDLDAEQLRGILRTELEFSHALRDAARRVLSGLESKDKSELAGGLNGLKVLLAA